MGIELSIHEGALDEALAVVEHAIHLKGGDILPQRGELALLYGAYLTFGVEHIDMDALHAEKAVGHGRTRIARGSHKHINLFLLTNESAEVIIIKNKIERKYYESKENNSINACGMYSSLRL